MKQTRKRWGWRWGGLLAVVLAGGYGVWALARPLADLLPLAATSQLRSAAATSALQWPASGQSAVAIVGSPILETHGPQTPRPTASTAKIITALLVLQRHPLGASQSGPLVTLTARDVALYNNYYVLDGSIVPVRAGEQITQYQMLQAMLLPSGDNMADSLALWAYGSLPAYAAAANAYLAAHGLAATHVGSDASGLAPDTTSTAGDLARLGALVMRQPVLAEIVAQPAASGIPVANAITNTNFLLGTASIIGIKTGHSDPAGGAYVSASTATIDNKKLTIVTALLGTPLADPSAALTGSLPLIRSAQANFHAATITKAGTTVGRYRLPWANGATVSAVVAQDLAVTAWNGSSVSATAKLQSISASAVAGVTIGTIKIPASAAAKQQSIPLKLKTTPAPPSIWWRLTHP